MLHCRLSLKHLHQPRSIWHGHSSSSKHKQIQQTCTNSSSNSLSLQMGCPYHKPGPCSPAVAEQREDQVYCQCVDRPVVTMLWCAKLKHCATDICRHMHRAAVSCQFASVQFFCTIAQSCETYMTFLHGNLVVRCSVPYLCPCTRPAAAVMGRIS